MKHEFLTNPSAFIWDLDGTLLDSYEVIVPSLYKTYREFGLELDQKEILKEVITYSVSSYTSKIEREYGIPFDAVKERYFENKDNEMLNIKPINHAEEILLYLQNRNIPNYVFTHRGTSTKIVLQNIGIYGYFDEIVTGADGFARKPDPSAINYLVRKYGLDKNSTYYVGDRTLDIECAENAGIQSCLYLPESSVAKPNGKETCIIKDLLDIKELVEKRPCGFGSR